VLWRVVVVATSNQCIRVLRVWSVLAISSGATCHYLTRVTTRCDEGMSIGRADVAYASI